MLYRGRFADWNTQNLIALATMRHHISTDNRAILDAFATARNKPMIPRLIGILSSGIYRQTLPGNIGLILAALLKRL
jgi:hypothetical protein